MMVECTAQTTEMELVLALQTKLFQNTEVFNMLQSKCNISGQRLIFYPGGVRWKVRQKLKFVSTGGTARSRGDVWDLCNEKCGHVLLMIYLLHKFFHFLVFLFCWLQPNAIRGFLWAPLQWDCTGVSVCKSSVSVLGMWKCVWKARRS